MTVDQRKAEDKKREQEKCAHQFNVHGAPSREKHCVKCGFTKKEE